MTAPATDALDAWWFDYMGRAAMDLRPRLKTFLVIEGGRRMLGERTPRCRALDLKIIKGKNQP